MSWGSWEKTAKKGPAGIVLRIAFAVVGISIVLGAVGFALNPFQQAGRIINKTIDADNVIANYEWFKQRHEDVSAIDAKITQADLAVINFAESAGDREKWHREDRVEHSRLSAVSLGLKQQRADLAAEYNAKSRMVNRSIFKAGDTELPSRIPTE